MWTLLAIFFLLVLYAVHWVKSATEDLPPGPPVLPLVGNALSLLRPGNSYKTLQKWVKEYGPLIRVYVGNTLVIVLGDYKTIHEALVKQADAFSGRPAMAYFLPKGVPPNHGLVLSEGDLWKEQRRFALSTLRDFGFGRPVLEPSIIAETEYLLEAVGETNGQPTDLRKILNNAVSNVICSMVFGKRFNYSDNNFWDVLDKINYRASESEIEFISPFVIYETLARAITILPEVRKFKDEGDQLSAYVSKLIQETKQMYDSTEEPSNYIHAFMKATEKGQGEYFTSAQLLATVMDLFMAGTDSTTGTLRFGLFFMAKHPDIQERMYRELVQVFGPDGHLPRLADRNRLPYTEAILMEIQRIATLAPMAALHKTTVHTELLGYKIPKGSLIVPFLWNVLHDPERYPNPEEFDPSRFLDENDALVRDVSWIPFSLGKRVCLGESLVKLELFLFFTSLILNFRFSFPCNGPAQQFKRLVGFTSSLGPYELCVERRDTISGES